MTPDEVGPMARQIAAAIATRGARMAVEGMAAGFLREVSAALTRTTSARGPGTAHYVRGGRADDPQSPAPAGGPPALVTGDLRRSGRMGRVMAVAGGATCSDSWYSPYAATQEFGGERGGLARWVDAAGYHNLDGRTVTPQRSYVRTTLKQMTSDGSLTTAAIRGYEAAGVLEPFAAGS